MQSEKEIAMEHSKEIWDKFIEQKKYELKPFLLVATYAGIWAIIIIGILYGVYKFTDPKQGLNIMMTIVTSFVLTGMFISTTGWLMVNWETAKKSILKKYKKKPKKKTGGIK